MYTLAVFLGDDECTRSRLVPPGTDDLCFAPDLILQGLLQDSIQPNVVMRSSMCVGRNFLLCNKHPDVVALCETWRVEEVHRETM